MSLNEYAKEQYKILESIAAAIRNARERKGLTIEETAERAGIEEKQLKNIESFKQIPHYALLDKLDGILDIEKTLGWENVLYDLISKSVILRKEHFAFMEEEEDTGIIKDRIGYRIAELRKDKFSQQALAQKAGIAQSSLSKLESASIYVTSRHILEKIAGALNIPFTELIQDTEYEALGLNRTEPEFVGSISFCPNRNCPNAIYIKRWNTGDKEIEFFRYSRFPLKAENEKQIKFCKYCGTELVLRCRCGEEIESEKQRYCAYCGTKIFPEESEVIDFGYTQDVERRDTLSALTPKRLI